MMLAARGAIRASGAGLPYDAEVEYLEFTGTQHIDSGINYFPDFDIDVLIPSGVPNLTLYSDTQHLLERKNASQPYWVVTAPESLLSSVPIAGRHRVVFRNSVLAIDNTTIGTVGNRTSGSGTCLIFRRKGGAAYNGTLYGLKMWDSNGVLVRDYIPVRKKTVGYLYDRVSGKLFGNAGTGDFVLGSDVVPVEYIESHGTEYINAGFATTGNGLRVRLACEKTTSTTSEMAVVGRNAGGGFELYISGGKCGLWNASSKYVVNDVSIVQGTKYSIYATISSSGASLTVNGSEKTSSFTPSEPSAANVLMFRHSSQYYFVGRMYPCEMWNNDVLTRSFCPVRVGTEGAMMDTLTRRIYRNQGTGAFTFGNDRRYPIPA